MSAPKSVELVKIVNALKSLRTNINVPTRFHDRMIRTRSLLSNDKTGMVNTVLDFMVHSATVPLTIETDNNTLNTMLKVWQKQLLNKNLNIDIPRGLRDLSAEYFRERWTSSFIALNVIWEEQQFPDGSFFDVPAKMWFSDGSAIHVDHEDGNLNTMRYFLGDKLQKSSQLINKTDQSILIRKPFSSWYESYPTPFLVRRGVLFNALLKEAIITKQADVIESVIPYLLLLKAGTDRLAELNMLADEESLKDLKDSIIKATEEHDVTGDLGKLIASLSYDVNIEHLIPDLNKIFSSDITQATDRNILAGLGLIELQGFSSNRQETILNPKVLVEEVTDAVLDWCYLLEEVMLIMIERNQRKHPKFTSSDIRVVAGKIKAFITDDMRSLLRSLYDRGLVSRQSSTEVIGGFDFEVEVGRIIKERERDLQRTMQPPVINNLEQSVDPDLEDENKKPGTPEADNFNNAMAHLYKNKTAKKQNKITVPYQNIDELPKNIKSVLPVTAQLLFIKTFNESLDKNDEETALKDAWSVIKKQYKKDTDSENWVKKATLEDYEKTMSSFVYSFFKDVYAVALDKSGSEDNSLVTALAIVEKFCKKNQSGIWVKNRSITQDQIASVDDPEVMDKLLDMELKQRKLQLLDKILEKKNGL